MLDGMRARVAAVALIAALVPLAPRRGADTARSSGGGDVVLAPSRPASMPSSGRRWFADRTPPAPERARSRRCSNLRTSISSRSTRTSTGSLAADQDDAYHVFARRCGSRGVLTEDCDASEIVFDHLVYVRSATSDGGFAFSVVALTVERPVGNELAIAPENPFGAPSGPGPVAVPDRGDPRRDPGALSRLADEIAAGTQSVLEVDPASELGVVRSFIPPEHTTYPYPYERIAAVFDDSDAPDLLFVSDAFGRSRREPPRGGHGSLDVTQSAPRCSFRAAARAGRRSPRPTRRALADPPRRHRADRREGARDLAERGGALLERRQCRREPGRAGALLLRQDGKPVDALLERRVNVFVVVIDGMIPENITATDTPNLCNLTACPGAGHARCEHERDRVRSCARGDGVADQREPHRDDDRRVRRHERHRRQQRLRPHRANLSIPLERPELVRVDTLFDVLRRERPELTTAAVLGKAKLRSLFDCTNTSGVCTADLATNPEGVPVTHARPDYLRGALELPRCRARRLPGRAGERVGVATDECIMDQVIELSATEDPDFVFVNLGNVDAVQHVSGPNSPAADAAVCSPTRRSVASSPT
jgi:hypothetical protein